jgi:hypothetical protein
MHVIVVNWKRPNGKSRESMSAKQMKYELRKTTEAVQKEMVTMVRPFNYRCFLHFIMTNIYITKFQGRMGFVQYNL